jgi:hypothetical protein
MKQKLYILEIKDSHVKNGSNIQNFLTVKKQIPTHTTQQQHVQQLFHSACPFF